MWWYCLLITVPMLKNISIFFCFRQWTELSSAAASVHMYACSAAGQSFPVLQHLFTCTLALLLDRAFQCCSVCSLNCTVALLLDRAFQCCSICSHVRLLCSWWLAVNEDKKYKWIRYIREKREGKMKRGDKESLVSDSLWSCFLLFIKLFAKLLSEIQFLPKQR